MGAVLRRRRSTLRKSFAAWEGDSAEPCARTGQSACRLHARLGVRSEIVKDFLDFWQRSVKVSPISWSVILSPHACESILWSAACAWPNRLVYVRQVGSLPVVRRMPTDEFAPEVHAVAPAQSVTQDDCEARVVAFAIALDDGVGGLHATGLRQFRLRPFQHLPENGFNDDLLAARSACASRRGHAPPG